MSYKETKKSQINAYKGSGAIKRNSIVRLTSAGLAIQANNATSPVHGLTDLNKDAADGDDVSVITDGNGKVKLAGNVAANALISANSDGLGVAASSGDHVVGQAQENGVTGQVISVKVLPQKA